MQLYSLLKQQFALQHMMYVGRVVLQSAAEIFRRCFRPA